SRLPSRASALPVTTSLSPLLYEFEVSRKLIPSASARSMIANESFSSVLPPKFMHPSASAETSTPVRPNKRYSMPTSVMNLRDVAHNDALDKFPATLDTHQLVVIPRRRSDLPLIAIGRQEQIVDGCAGAIG